MPDLEPPESSDEIPPGIPMARRRWPGAEPMPGRDDALRFGLLSLGIENARESSLSESPCSVEFLVLSAPPGRRCRCREDLDGAGPSFSAASSGREGWGGGRGRSAGAGRSAGRTIA